MMLLLPKQVHMFNLYANETGNLNKQNKLGHKISAKVKKGTALCKLWRQK